MGFAKNGNGASTKMDKMGEEVALTAEEKKKKDEEKTTETEGEKAKKGVYKAAYLSEWEPEAIQTFLTECASGVLSAESGFVDLSRKPKLAAIPSEAKIVKAPGRSGEDDGTKKGTGERVGRRADDSADGEDEEELEDLLEDLDGEETEEAVDDEVEL